LGRKLFALTTIIRGTDGSVRVEDGTLYRLPPELVDLPRLKKYGTISSPGWGLSEFSYSYYARLNSEGELLIFPGLIIDGAPRPTKKFSGYSQQFRRDQVERFAEQIVAAFDNMRTQAQIDLTILIHDLRSLSTTIYNAAMEAQSYVKTEDWYNAEERIKNVLAAQGILKIRTDALDFEGNTSGEIELANVPIFRRVDKVNKCMKPRATGMRLTTRLLGESHKSSRGPNVFEIVPYALLDNAIKYSPPDRLVSVEVKDLSDRIVLRVSSEGPAMNEEEKQKIFERGFRGQGAIRSGKPGSGLGLFLASRIVQEHFHGRIRVVQSSCTAASDNQVPTEFVVELPAV
jgi:signal transduction histidine kinase